MPLIVAAPASSSGCSPTSRTRCSTRCAARSRSPTSTHLVPRRQPAAPTATPTPSPPSCSPPPRSAPTDGRRRPTSSSSRRRWPRRAGSRSEQHRAARPRRARCASASSRASADGRRRQRRHRQARPRRLPRVEDAAHRRAPRRPVPARLRRWRVRRPGPGARACLGGRPGRSAVAGLRGQRARPAGRQPASRSRPGTLSPPMHPGCRCLLFAVRRVALAARAATLGPSSAGRVGDGSPAGRCSSSPGSPSSSSSCFGRALARFYVDYLWHDGLGARDVFWGVIRAKVTLFAMFFAAFAVIAGAQPGIADRLVAVAVPGQRRTRSSSASTRCSAIACGCCATSAPACSPILVALPTTSQWQAWLLFRNSQSFGIADAPVRRRRRLLRVRAAVHQLRARLAVRRHDPRAAAHGAHPRAQRRRRVRLADADRAARRPRATSPCCSPCSPR